MGRYPIPFGTRHAPGPPHLPPMSEQPSDPPAQPPNTRASDSARKPPASSPLDPPDPQDSAAVAAGSAVPPVTPDLGEASTGELLEQLRQDRLWLLRQLDSGRWSEWRLDLAALERELGQLLDQIDERRGVS